MQNEIAIPEPGVPEDKWMRVGPAYVVNLREENAKLRAVLTDADEALTEMGWHTDRGLLQRIREVLKP